MCIKSGLRAVATAAALLLPAALSPAEAGNFGGGAPPPASLPGIGVGAYAPGQGPVGTSGWNGGNWHGHANAYGTFWGGGYYGGEGGGGDSVAHGGGAAVYTYNHYDNRRRDGGFYGGGGVFYGDDGYSRLTPAAPAARGSATGVQENPHIIRLPEVNATAAHRRAMRREAMQ
ncbi:MAG: hypothetical protein ACR652_00750 [Methylocystis sp.]|uniref:hypothetical protein n=1 Tax=Methylocystis sp. TaxID=1911079 RepID=UPI003DA3254E